MAAVVLERTRILHEDIERYQKGIREQIDFQPSTQKESMQQINAVSRCLDQMQECAKELTKIYEDKKGQRKEEIASLGTGQQGPQLYSLFYDRLKEIRKYYRQFPEASLERPEDRVGLDIEGEVPQFTGEEKYGRYLDLHQFHHRYLNFKWVTKKIDYYTFLDKFFKFKPKQQYTQEYIQYLQELFDYLISFLQRSQPFINLDKMLKEAESQLEEELKALEQLKDPLVCDACNKKFAKETVFQAHLTGKKHIKNVEKKGTVYMDSLRLEAKIQAVCKKVLAETITNTKIHVEKKLSRLPDEQSEDDDEIIPTYSKEVEPDEAEEMEIRTTKENYPVGWDGKPIPYWLYKLHGLGVEYKCEICGNASYWGRKAFEMHFQEWRHAHGLKCLGIPNTKVFRDITKINDALILWEKLKRESGTREWKPEAEEEFEDRDGNVFNKKLYDDLRAQGLL